MVLLTRRIARTLVNCNSNSVFWIEIWFTTTKSPGLSVEAVFALQIYPGRPSVVMPSATVRWTVAGIKKPPHFCGGFVFALPIFPCSRPQSIVGADVLNFCVRDGNRWTLMTINTNSMDGFNHLLLKHGLPWFKLW